MSAPTAGSDAAAPKRLPKTRHPGRLRKLWGTTIGKKYVVAVTGGIMGAWLALHMLGNLKALGGDGNGHPALDHYAEWLRTAGEPVIPRNGVLWITRIVILSAIVLHVIAITQLYKRNRAARPAGHRKPARVRRTLAARTMYVTGPLLLSFLVFHILQFTTRTIHPTPLHKGTVYANLDGAFQKWWLVAIYVGAVASLGLHLWHAFWSAPQTAGLDNPDRNLFWRRSAAAATLLIAVGFALPPILFFVGALPDA